VGTTVLKLLGCRVQKWIILVEDVAFEYSGTDIEIQLAFTLYLV
jgi:hypothetical protein